VEKKIKRKRMSKKERKEEWYLPKVKIKIKV